MPIAEAVRLATSPPIFIASSSLLASSRAVSDTCLLWADFLLALGDVRLAMLSFGVVLLLILPKDHLEARSFCGVDPNWSSASSSATSSVGRANSSSSLASTSASWSCLVDLGGVLPVLFCLLLRVFRGLAWPLEGVLGFELAGCCRVTRSSFLLDRRRSLTSNTGLSEISTTPYTSTFAELLLADRRVERSIECGSEEKGLRRLRFDDRGVSAITDSIRYQVSDHNRTFNGISCGGQ